MRGPGGRSSAGQRCPCVEPGGGSQWSAGVAVVRRRLVVSFHLGKPILVMLVLALMCGIGIALRPGKGERADLVLWVFADAHARTYRGDRTTTEPTLVDSFRQKTGMTADVQL